MPKTGVLVTGACGVTSRSVVRALRQDNDQLQELLLVGTDTGHNPYGFHERLCDSYYKVPHADDSRYWSSIHRICESGDLKAALVVPEVELIRWVSDNQAQLDALLPGQTFALTAGSKACLYEALEGTGLVPEFRNIPSMNQDFEAATYDFPFPAWLRPHEIGASSGRAAGRVEDQQGALAWTKAHPEIKSWQLVKFVGGRNFSANVLMINGHFVAGAQYERLDYFMAKTTLSGVTGNISRGRLDFCPVVADTTLAAIRHLEGHTGERASGLYGVDLLLSNEDDERGFVTEVNLRPTACIESFALGGFNLASYWLKATLGEDFAWPGWAEFQGSQEILRDIDGVPLVVDPATHVPYTDLTL